MSPGRPTRYQADFYDRSGQRHRRMFDLKKDAQRWLDEQTAGLVTGQWADPRAGKESVRAYGERWLERQVLAHNTVATYGTILSNHIYPTLGTMRMAAVNRADVQSLVKEWQLTAAPSTVEARYSILAIMLRAAIKDRVIPVTPCVDIKLPKVAAKGALVPIDTETVLALREAIYADTGCCRHRRRNRDAPWRDPRPDRRPHRLRVRHHSHRPPTRPDQP